MGRRAMTDAGGRYAVSLPYGKYRIDGYNLDYSIVDAVLSGKTDSPQNNQYRSDDIIVPVVAGFVMAVLIGFATMFVGFIVLMPLIGHATWHAYRQTIDAAMWPSRKAG